MVSQHQQPIAYKVNEACRVARVSRYTLYRAIRDKQLRTARIGRRRVVLHDALMEWLKKAEE
jgi:excisionase family DNA binding protein